ncbi:MarR family transcriptional regulator [Bacillus sp. BGMRC 2118]|nr:MarR family transcriptional regulator [Bacillus sp. BGMRC 2118]
MDQALLHVMINHWRGMYKVLEHDWQKAAKEIGVTSSELHVLWIVSLEKIAPMTKIAELGLWDVSTVAQMITRLKRKMLIHTTKDKNDRRITWCELTPLGIETVKKSKEYNFQFVDFVTAQKGDNVNKHELIENLRSFQIEFNRHFHGEKFVEWIDKTEKQLP